MHQQHLFFYLLNGPIICFILIKQPLCCYYYYYFYVYDYCYDDIMANWGQGFWGENLRMLRNAVLDGKWEQCSILLLRLRLKEDRLGRTLAPCELELTQISWVQGGRGIAWRSWSCISCHVGLYNRILFYTPSVRVMSILFERKWSRKCRLNRCFSRVCNY